MHYCDIAVELKADSKRRMMAWFSRKPKTTVDVQATALQVRRALRLQIEKAQEMAGESDLSRFYKKDLIIGYVFGFLNQFFQTVGIDDENMHCMIRLMPLLPVRSACCR